MKMVRVLLVAGLLPTALNSQAPSQSASDPKAVRFAVRVENISAKSLILSTGDSADIPVSPVLWVVHTGVNPLFKPGEVEGGTGLEALAESGRARPLLSSLTNAKLAAVHLSGVENTPAGTTSPGLLEAGQRYEFTFEAKPGHRLSLAMMNGQSNDGLIAAGPTGIELFRAGRPLSGDITGQLSHWDAGTEANEEPGLGRNQGLRQGAPHAGDPERKPVRPIDESEFGKLWPPVSKVLRVTITPATSP